MVGRALSETAKATKQRCLANDKMAAALDAYAQEQAKPPGEKKKGVRKVALEHGVNYSTLNRLARGGVSMSTFNAKKRRLMHAEERVVVNWILEEADRGFPTSFKGVEKVANGILESRNGPTYKSVGGNWVDRFVERHRDEVQSHWSKPLDTARARSLNPTVVSHWFNKVVKEQYVDQGIKPENTYGMDESGFPPEASQTRRVLGRRGTKTQHKQGNANRENVTALVSICADGTVLRPTIIFKGKNFMKNWADNNASEASFAHSPNGWTDGELALRWMVDDFDAQTVDKAAGEPRALFLDGHSSHYTPELLRYALDKNIVILAYPPHCTHALQGLDVVCFARMKQTWNEEVERFEAEHDHGVNKGDFAGVFGAAFKRAFTEETCCAAFRATGLVPFNPNIITATQMKPSEPTSIKGSFPLPQPSPVRAVMSSLHRTPATQFDIDETHNMAGPSQYSGSSSLASSPVRNQDPNLDPALFTPSKRLRDPETDTEESPSKRVRMLRSRLASTSSGSILVSKTVITSSYLITRPVLEVPPRLEEPNWILLDPGHADGYQTRETLIKHNHELTEALERSREHVLTRNHIIEGAHAHMVIQNMHLDKINAALKGKETKAAKKTDRSRLFPAGHGRHITNSVFIETLEAEKVQRAEDTATKAQNQAKAADKKAEKAAIESQWKAICTAHILAVEKWAADIVRLKAAGTAKKSLPSKPKRPLKPTLKSSAVSQDLESGAGDVENGSDSEDDDEFGMAET